MIKIDDKYDVILTYSPIIEITGHIFECFDYYLFLRKYYKVGILFFGGLKEEKLKIAFNSKYTIDYDDVKDDFIFISYNDIGKIPQLIIFPANTFVLITDGNISSFRMNKISLISKHIYGFSCETPTYEGNEMYKNITLLSDYRIYGKNKYFNSIDYVKKIPFDFYRKNNRPNNENVGLMYVTFVCRKISRETIKEYHKKSNCKKTILVVPYKLEEYENIDDVEQIEAPVDDFFNKFDTYIYTPVQRHFDCSPRLITECFLQNKKVFLDINYVDLGLQTRYNDCKEDINRIILKENDKILEIIENAKRN